MHKRRISTSLGRCNQQIQKNGKQYMVTKYPIVLNHGLFGYDQLGLSQYPRFRARYWSGVQEALEERGVKVYVAKVPPTGGIEERAHHLKKFLEQNLANQDVNLISHSMGGLDSRYLITHGQPAGVTIRSLTTITTPHRGSTFMDWIRDNFRIGLGNDHQSKHLLDRVMSILDQPAYSNLTTDFCRNKFNPQTPDDQNVKYMSYGAAIENIAKLSPLRFSYEIIKEKEGPNDGYVSVSSSMWGEYIETLQTDHFHVNKIVEPSNFWPSFDFNVNLPLNDLAGYLAPLVNQLNVQPLIKALPLRSLLGSDKKQLTPQEAYRQRVQQIFDAKAGPNSYDEYVYGMDHHDEVKDAEPSMPTKAQFDARIFYLELMDKLAKHGF